MPHLCSYAQLPSNSCPSPLVYLGGHLGICPRGRSRYLAGFVHIGAFPRSEQLCTLLVGHAHRLRVHGLALRPLMEDPSNGPKVDGGQAGLGLSYLG